MQGGGLKQRRVVKDGKLKGRTQNGRRIIARAIDTADAASMEGMYCMNLSPCCIVISATYCADEQVVRQGNGMSRQPPPHRASVMDTS